MITDIRCDAHVGEVFPPRCTACATLQAEYSPYARFGDREDGIEL